MNSGNMVADIKTDLLIVGGGLAGVTAALTAQNIFKNIIIVTKGRLFFCGSSFNNINNQLGVSYAKNDFEKEELLQRINALSCGTNSQKLTKILVDYSSLAFQDLYEKGVEFIHDDQGGVRRFAPCYYNRPRASIISSVSQMGRCLESQLNRSVVTAIEDLAITSIVKDDDGFLCFGSEHNGVCHTIAAGTLILATGGDAASKKPNLVEPGLTGDGYRILKNLGVGLTNMKYHQLVWEDVEIPQKRFVHTKFTDQDFTFRDYRGVKIPLQDVSTDIMNSRKTHVPIANLQEDRCVDELLFRRMPSFTTEYAINVENKVGDTVSRILPYFQACNGGVEIGVNGETGVSGLYAAGELTTGMHGGDRVGGMMSTSAMVFAKKAALHACKTRL